MNQIQYLNRRLVREGAEFLKRTLISSLNFQSVCQVLYIYVTTFSFHKWQSKKAIFIFTDKKTNPHRIKIISVQDHIAGSVLLTIFQSKLSVCYSCLLEYCDFFKSIYHNFYLCIYSCAYLLPLSSTHAHTVM